VIFSVTPNAAGVDVTPDSQLYLTGLLAYNKANESFNYRPPISGSARKAPPAPRS